MSIGFPLLSRISSYIHNTQSRTRKLQCPAATRRVAQAIRPILESLENRQLLSAGDLDPTFGAGGTVITPFPGGTYDRATAAVAQSDGKILVAGTSDGKIALVRYNTDGSSDTNLGGTGRVVVAVTGSGYVSVNAIAIQNLRVSDIATSTKIIVAGSTGFASNSDFLVGRFNMDGSLDTAFGQGGFAIVDFSGQADVASSVLIDNSGQIILGGYTTVAGSTSGSLNTDFALARFTPSGQLDIRPSDSTPFQSGKVVTHVTGDNDGIAAMTFDGSSIVVAGVSGQLGSTSNDGYTSHPTVARYLSDGSLDTLYNRNTALDGTVTGGIATADFAGSASGLVIDSGGRVIIGAGGIGGGFYLSRFTTDGKLDQNFVSSDSSSTGHVLATFPNQQYSDPKSMALDSQGHIVMAGIVDGTAGGRNFAVMRFNVIAGSPNTVASLDNSFGGTGYVQVEMGSANDSAAAMVLSGTSVIVAGTGHAPDISADAGSFAIAKLDAQGVLDSSFGTGGRAYTAVAGDGNSNSDAVSMVVQPDGKTILAGTTRDPSLAATPDAYRFALVRYNVDGSLDESFGEGGRVVTNLPTYGEQITAIALQTDGKIVVVGIARDDRTASDDLAIVRYDTHGRLDGSFGTNGILIKALSATTTDGTSTQLALADFNPAQITPNAVSLIGRCVVIDSTGIITVGGETSGIINDFAVIRIDADGNVLPDADGGLITTDIGTTGTPDMPYSVALEPDGDILLAGTSPDPVTGNFGIAVVRYHSIALPQTGFTSTVIRVSNATVMTADAIAIETGGAILIGGVAADVSSDMFATTFAVTRLLPDGTPDLHFGTDGTVRTMSSLTPDIPAVDMVVQAGKIIITGGIDLDGQGRQFATVRYNADGTLDASFGYKTPSKLDSTLIWNGVLTPFNASDAVANAVAIDPSTGMIVVGGTAAAGRGYFALARYDSGPTITPIKATLTGPSSGVPYQPLTFSGAVTGLPTGGTGTIDYGDSSPIEAFVFDASGGFSFAHAFTATGPHTVTVKIDGCSTSASQSVDIQATQVVDDPTDSTKSILAVGGSSSSDIINVGQILASLQAPAGGASINSLSLASSAKPISRVVVFGGDGDDVITATGLTGVVCEFYGGSGNDVLIAGNAGSILVGGDGNDMILDGSGRDLLIGGDGADAVIGNAGDDILVAGMTDYDNQPEALWSVLAEWNRTDLSYAARVDHLSGKTSGGKNGSMVFNASTVHDDSAMDEFTIDLLVGGTGQDWYLCNTSGPGQKDIVLAAPSETRTDIDVEKTA